jgi:hypothetical protein
VINQYDFKIINRAGFLAGPVCFLGVCWPVGLFSQINFDFVSVLIIFALIIKLFTKKLSKLCG